MSDMILARVSQSLATEQSVESLVRQLLEMLEVVTEMESTYLTKVDLDARLQHILYARNSCQMQIPEGLSVPWMRRCANALLRKTVCTATTCPYDGRNVPPLAHWTSPLF